MTNECRKCNTELLNINIILNFSTYLTILLLQQKKLLFDIEICVNYCCYLLNISDNLEKTFENMIDGQLCIVAICDVILFLSVTILYND